MSELFTRSYGCELRGSVFRHSNSRTRHYLSAHQTVWQRVQFVAVGPEELARRRESLRRNQVSSRRRRRQLRHVPAQDAVGLEPGLVAAIRTMEPSVSSSSMAVED